MLYYVHWLVTNISFLPLGAGQVARSQFISFLAENKVFDESGNTELKQ